MLAGGGNKKAQACNIRDVDHSPCTHCKTLGTRSEMSRFIMLAVNIVLNMCKNFDYTFCNIFKGHVEILEH